MESANLLGSQKPFSQSQASPCDVPAEKPTPPGPGGEFSQKSQLLGRRDWERNFRGKPLRREGKELTLYLSHQTPTEDNRLGRIKADSCQRGQEQRMGNKPRKPQLLTFGGPAALPGVGFWRLGAAGWAPGVTAQQDPSFLL